ncbi:S26 family signal peptidase [Thermomonospora echinospora]|uniref:S26 family signal peptidase n=1 Tax=Thermomonospora echinospora TaxID=1992 RepID=UPI000CDE8328|nr:S26 family signal peptidase [Thermomonospora echinospora]
MSTIGIVAGFGAGSAAAIGAALLLRRRRIIIQVRGESMYPALRHGDRLLVRPCEAAEVSVGDIVVIESPGRDLSWTTPPATRWTRDRRWLVKRVVAVPGDRRPDVLPAVTRVPEVVAPKTLIVLSDNGGLDSRVFGPIPFERLFGVAVRRMFDERGGGREAIRRDAPSP